MTSFRQTELTELLESELLAKGLIVLVLVVAFFLITLHYELTHSQRAAKVEENQSNSIATVPVDSGDADCDFQPAPSIPALASAYAHYGKTACGTRTKLAPYRTLAMSTEFREAHDFHYGDLFTIHDSRASFEDVVWVLEDHLPAKYKAEIDLFFGNRDAASEWGLQEVVVEKIGHLEHPKYQAKEKWLGR